MTSAAKAAKTGTHWRRVFALTLFAGLMLASLALANSGRAAIETPPPPSVWSDKADYAPGDTVTLSGANWAPGESVHIRVNDDAGQTWTRDVDVTAAADGTISDEFDLATSFVAVYTVTATGAQSGTATWSFTDGNVKWDIQPTLSRATFVENIFTAATDCTGAFRTNGGFPNKTETNSLGDSQGVGNSESLRVDASATTTNAPTQSFQGWITTDSPASPFTVIAGTNGLSVCFPGFSGNGTRNYRALYGNLPPTIASNNASVTVNEGSTATNTGTWSDGNPSETVTLTASVGTVIKSGTNASGTWSWSLGTTDGPNQSQIVSITANDGTTTRTTTFLLTVNNVAPTATFNAPTSVNEGSNISLSLTSPSDPSSVDTAAGFTYAFDCGAGYGAFSSTNSATCPTNDNEIRTVKGKISDKDGGVTEYTATVTVLNVAPTATFNAPATVNEGTDIQLSLTGPVDPSSIDTTSGFGYAFDCGDGSGYGGFSSTNTASCQTPDNGIRSVKGKIRDKDGGETESTASVTINNVAPTGTFPATRTVDEGSSSTFSFLGQFDPSTADVIAGFHYAYSCSGASLGSATYASSGTSASVSCSFGDGPGSQTVRARIIDKDGGFTEYTTAVVVNNVAPTATFANDGPVNEGTSFHLSLTSPFDPSSADAGAGFEYAFDCGDGSGYGAWSASNTATCSTTDNGVRSVKGKIRDKDLDASEYTASVTVNNVAPTATFNAPTSVDEGSDTNLSLTSPFDPSSADTSAGFEYAFDCGSGYGTFSSTNSASCPTNDNGTRSVKGKIKDKDGGETEYTASVTIDNVAPTATFGNDGPVNEGTSFHLSLTSPFDPSSADTSAGFEYAFDCGDGSGYGAWGASNTATCSTNDNGTRSVKGKIRDKDLDASEYTASVTVNNVAPTATFANDGPVNEGTSFHLSLTSPSDPSSADTSAGFEYAFDCGDGSGYGAFSGSNTATCTTSDDGVRSVAGKIRDKDGGVTEYTASVTVNNVAPDVDLTGDSTVPEGGTRTHSYTVFDPGNETFVRVDQTCDGGTLSNDSFNSATGAGSFDCSWPDGPSSHSPSVTISDGDGGSDSDFVAVTVNNVEPSTPNLTSPDDNANTNDTTPTLDWDDSTDPAGAYDTITYSLQVDDNGCGLTSPEIDQTGLSSSEFTPLSALAQGTYCWRVKASDEDGGVSAWSSTRKFTIDTDGPSVTINQAASQADPTSSAPIKFTVVFSEAVTDFTNADVNLSDSTAGGTLSANVYDSGDHKTYEVRVNGMTTAGDVIAKIGANKAQDAAGNGNSASTSTDNKVTWQPAAGNTTPVVTLIQPAFGSVYAKGSAGINPLTLKASFTDPDNGPWTYLINWDDGTPNSSGSATPAPSTFQATHSYTTTGVFTINVCVKDTLGASGCASVWIVVYDPNGGFVTGGGWINVAAGSYSANAALSGRANFGFNSQYKKNANVPTGETEFNFQVGNFNFHSEAYTWLVVSSFKAQYRGTGSVNGVSGYDFTLTVYDGDISGGGGADKFRIRITKTSNGNVVFDNRISSPAGPDNIDTADPQVIAGGSIVIHKA